MLNFVNLRKVSENLGLTYPSQVKLLLETSTCLANPSAPSAYLRINSGDNYALNESGFLLIPKSVFYDIYLFIESENIQNVSDITIFMLHPIITRTEGVDTYYLTLKEYEADLIKKYEPCEISRLIANQTQRNERMRELGMSQVQDKKKLTAEDVIHWPKGYKKGGKYTLVTRTPIRVVPKVLIDAGYTQQLAQNMCLAFDKKPSWHNVGQGVLTTTVKQLSLDCIFVPKDSFPIEPTETPEMMPVPPCLDPTNTKRFNPLIQAQIKLDAHLHDNNMFQKMKKDKHLDELKKLCPDLSSSENYLKQIVALVRGGKIKGGAKKKSEKLE